jgi:hypothetical protein
LGRDGDSENETQFRAMREAFTVHPRQRLLGVVEGSLHLSGRSERPGGGIEPQRNRSVIGVLGCVEAARDGVAR